MTSPTTGPRPDLRRLTALCFGVSSLIPLYASLGRTQAVFAVTVLDLVLSFLLIILACLTWRAGAASAGDQDSRRIVRAYSYAAFGPLLLVAIYLGAPVDLQWPILLVGLGWRYGLLLMTLPALLPTTK